MNIVWRFGVVSFGVWLVPFVVSLPFFNREGQLITGFWLFKAIMALVLVSSALVLFRWFYRSTVRNQNWATFVLFGFGAAAINIILDSFTIIPLTNTPPARYMVETASFYTAIVVASVYAGVRSLRARKG